MKNAEIEPRISVSRFAVHQYSVFAEGLFMAILNVVEIGECEAEVAAIGVAQSFLKAWQGAGGVAERSKAFGQASAYSGFGPSI
jgi:L-rhamnose mutarotase